MMKRVTEGENEEDSDLIEAVKNNNVDVVRQLLKDSEDPNTIINDYMDTALIYAS